MALAKLYIPSTTYYKQSLLMNYFCCSLQKDGSNRFLQVCYLHARLVRQPCFFETLDNYAMIDVIMSKLQSWQFSLLTSNLLLILIVFYQKILNKALVFGENYREHLIRYLESISSIFHSFLSHHQKKNWEWWEVRKILME